MTMDNGLITLADSTHDFGTRRPPTKKKKSERSSRFFENRINFEKKNMQNRAKSDFYSKNRNFGRKTENIWDNTSIAK